MRAVRTIARGATRLRASSVTPAVATPLVSTPQQRRYQPVQHGRRSVATVGIIGGGIAGLRAANVLLSTHKSCVVHLFEAKAVLGGRASTDMGSIPNFQFDKGAAHIQDPSYHDLKEIGERLGFASQQDSEEDFKIRADIDKDPEVENWQDLSIGQEDVQREVEQIARSFEHAKSKPNQIVGPFHQGKGTTSDTEMLALALSPYGPFSESAEPSQYLAADQARQREGDERGVMRVVGGVGSMLKQYAINNLKKPFGARYVEHVSTPITDIDCSAPDVVKLSGKAKASVDYCLVTVPPPVLENLAPKIKPALPAAHMDALRNVRLGSYKKVVLTLTTPKTVTVIKPGTKYYIRDELGVWSYIRPRWANHVLVATAAGNFAAHLDTLPDKDVIAQFRDLMAKAYHRDTEQVKFTAIAACTNWSADPYALGAYSYTAFNGGGPDDPQPLASRATLARPVGRLHFAGEHLDIDAYGTLHGAYQQGERAAKEILQLLPQ